MEQEPERPILYGTVKRVGYKLVLAAHIVFIVTAFIIVTTLLAILLISQLYS
jgi:hypothetical protein